MRRVFLICATLFVASVSRATSQAPYLLILGVTQDAGYPQAGCYAAHCKEGWEDKAKQRGAVSLGLVSPNTHAKYLFEATPNLPQQLYELELDAPSDQFNLAGVFLTHAHIGHYAGLMYFGHEAMGTKNVPVYAMPRMTSYLKNNGPWSQLVEFKNIELQVLTNGTPVTLDDISVTPFLVPHRDEYSETVGFRIDGPNKSALFIPDINKWPLWDQSLVEQVKSVDYALIDGAFYADGELPGRDMSAIPHPFVTETMATLDALSSAQRGRVFFIHLNHTNPLLDPSSEQSMAVRNAGFKVATEGVKLEL